MSRRESRREARVCRTGASGFAIVLCRRGSERVQGRGGSPQWIRSEDRVWRGELEALENTMTIRGGARSRRETRGANCFMARCLH